MNYDKYIFDWQNGLHDKKEYIDTDKYAFALFDKARNILVNYIDSNDLTNDDKEILNKINILLTEVYLETSHIELDFDD